MVFKYEAKGRIFDYIFIVGLVFADFIAFIGFLNLKESSKLTLFIISVIFIGYEFIIEIKIKSKKLCSYRIDDKKLYIETYRSRFIINICNIKCVTASRVYVIGTRKNYYIENYIILTNGNRIKVDNSYKNYKGYDIVYVLESSYNIKNIKKKDASSWFNHEYD